MPEKHRRRDRSFIEKLRVLREGNPAEAIMQAIDSVRLATIDVPQLVGRRGITAERLREHLRILAKAGRIRVLSDNPIVVVSGVAFSGAVDAALATVHKFHQANPLVQGIGREELKARVAGNGSSLLFQAILDKLAGDKKIVLAQEVIYEYGRAVTLNADEERMRVQLAERFRSLGLQIASMDETIDALKLNRQTARKIVQLMLKEKTLMKITEELLIDRTVLDQLIADVRALKSTNPKLGVGEFKNLTGVSRKHAIPLLEYLDRQRVTRRVGDERMIL